MKDRYLIRVYKVPDVREYPKGLDDIDEQTEEQLNPDRDFQYQIQGDDLLQVVKSLIRNL